MDADPDTDDAQAKRDDPGRKDTGREIDDVREQDDDAGDDPGESEDSL